jgi:hypothetical protein
MFPCVFRSLMLGSIELVQRSIFEKVLFPRTGSSISTWEAVELQGLTQVWFHACSWVLLHLDFIGVESFCSHISECVPGVTPSSTGHRRTHSSPNPQDKVTQSVILYQLSSNNICRWRSKLEKVNFDLYPDCWPPYLLFWIDGCRWWLYRWLSWFLQQDSPAPMLFTIVNSNVCYSAVHMANVESGGKLLTRSASIHCFTWSNVKCYMHAE